MTFSFFKRAVKSGLDESTKSFVMLMITFMQAAKAMAIPLSHATQSNITNITNITGINATEALLKHNKELAGTVAGATLMVILGVCALSAFCGKDNASRASNNPSPVRRI